MAYEMRAGQGSLFKNEKKTKDTQPGYKGKVMLPDGQIRYVDIWAKKTAAGETWLSLSIGDVVQVSGHSQDKVNGYQPQKENSDDIPF